VVWSKRLEFKKSTEFLIFFFTFAFFFQNVAQNFRIEVKLIQILVISFDFFKIFLNKEWKVINEMIDVIILEWPSMSPKNCIKMLFQFGSLLSELSLHQFGHISKITFSISQKLLSIEVKFFLSRFKLEQTSILDFGTIIDIIFFQNRSNTFRNFRESFAIRIKHLSNL